MRKGEERCERMGDRREGERRTGRKGKERRGKKWKGGRKTTSNKALNKYKMTTGICLKTLTTKR